MPESMLRVEIEAGTLDDLRAFVDEIQPDPGCRAIARRRGDAYVMDVYIAESRLDAARAARSAGGVSLRVIENASDVGRERQQEVGDGNRFAGRAEPPRGLGRKV